MHTLRKLAREIHRRSVWQVLGVYLAISWGILMLLELLSVRLGFPLWTPDMALALLLIGLPVVLATTIAQGGLHWLRIEDLVDPNVLVGRTPDEVHVVPEAHPLYGASILTWRNAILGGAMAGALLVTSVVAYLAMWGLGIGPVGSLLAQGILEPGDRVLFATLDDRTADPLVASTAARALADHLGRSTVVTIVSESELATSIGAGRATPERILDIASRAGIDVLITSEVERVAEGYVISGRILLSNGNRVAAYSEVATTAEGVPEAAATLSTRLREKIGESLRLIRAE
jgi:hypothetical protein